MLEQPCPAKVLRRKTKTDEVKCGLSFVAQHWTLLRAVKMMMWWWAKSNWLSLSQLLKSWFLSPMTLKDPNSLQTVKPPPLLPAWMPTEARVDAFSQGNNRPEDLQYCLSNLLKRSIWSVSLICLSDWPPNHNCTPRDCSERLPFWWTSSFF